MNEAEEDGEVSAPKKAGRATEKFHWVIKTKKGAVVKRSKDVFLSMRNCMEDAKRNKLNSTDVLDYETTQFKFETEDIIERVAMFLLNHDYQLIASTKCEGCTMLNGLADHALFCLKNGESVIDKSFMIKAHKRITEWRLHDDMLQIADVYNLHPRDISLVEVGQVLSRVNEDTYQKILDQSFEWELNVLND